MKKILLILIIVSFFLPLTIKSSQNDCVIVATEVYSRLKNKVYWIDIIGYKSMDGLFGHAICVWQIEKNSYILACNLYNDGATTQLKTSSHNIDKIIKAISRNKSAEWSIGKRWSLLHDKPLQ